MTLFWLTHEAGSLKKQGLRGKIIMVSGGALNLQALIAGEVDFVNAAGPALINAVQVMQKYMKLNDVDLLS